MADTNLSLKGPLATVPPNGAQDVFLMDKLVCRGFSQPRLLTLNPT